MNDLGKQLLLKKNKNNINNETNNTILQLIKKTNDLQAKVFLTENKNYELIEQNKLQQNTIQELEADKKNLLEQNELQQNTIQELNIILETLQNKINELEKQNKILENDKPIKSGPKFYFT